MMPDPPNNTSTLQERLLDLLLEAQERRERGQDVTPEELCRDCPELLEPLRQALHANAFMDGMLGNIRTPGFAADQAPAAAGGLPVVPGYEVVAKIGDGGMGVVYKAWQVKADRLVALKRVKAGVDASPEELARFRAEAEAVARLQHPNVVQIFEVGEHEGLPFFSMEYVDGGSLADQLQGTPQPARPAAELVEVLARAVHYAHQRGVVHRDLKPGNILLSDLSTNRTNRHEENKEPEKGQGATPSPSLIRADSCDSWIHSTPKITDFGLAKRLDVAGGQTQTGAIVGTPSYMAPEQASGTGKAIGPAADIYALGAILYECLTGRPPFKAENQLETLLQVRTEEPVRVRQLQPKVPRDLETICLKCLKKEPHKRYASAEEVAKDLQRFLEGEPIRARPVRAAERLWRWCRRNPRVAGLLTTLAVVLIGGFTVVTVLLVINREQRIEADRQRIQAEKDRRRALQAVDRMLVQVGGQRLLDFPYMEPVRRELLIEGLKFYQEFLQESGTDPVVRKEAARAYFWVGFIQAWLEEHVQAKENLGQAIALFDQLASEDPKEPQYRHFLGRIYYCLGRDLRATGHLREAQEAFGRSVAVHEDLASGYPEEASHRRELARTLNHLGLLLAETGSSKEAELTYRRALTVWERLKAETGDSDDHAGLASALYKRGLLLHDTGRPDQALKAHQEAADLLRELVKVHPKNSYYRWELGNSLNNLANALQAAGQREEAEKVDHEHLTHRQKLADDFPSIPEYRKNLAEAHSNRGWLLQHADSPRAEKAYREGLALKQQLVTEVPDVPEYRFTLANTLYNFGLLLSRINRAAEAEESCREAITLMEDLVKAYPQKPVYQNLLAGALGSLAWTLMRRNELAQARPLLERAVRHQQAALDVNPNNPRYQRHMGNHYFGLGLVLKRLGKDDEAEQAYRQSLTFREKLVDAFHDVPDYRSDLGAVQHDLALMLLRLEKLAEARQLFEQAIPHQQAALKADPQNSTYRQFLYFHTKSLAIVLGQQGEHAEAAKTAAELPRVFPERCLACCNAVRLLAPCIPLAEKDTNLPETERQAVAQGYTDRIRELLQEAEKRSAGDAMAQRSLAWFLATFEFPRFQDPAKAVELAKKAVEKQPKDFYGWCALGAAHYRAGDWEAAIAALEKSAELRGGGNSFDWFFLAMAHWQRKEPEKARQWYDRALHWMEKRMPKDEELRRFRAEAEHLIDGKSPQPPR